MAKLKGYQKKIIILLSLLIILVMVYFFNQDQIFKYIYKQRYLDGLTPKTSRLSGYQEKILNFNFPLLALDYFYSLGNIQAGDEKKWVNANLNMNNQDYSIEFSNFDSYFKKMNLSNKNRAFTIKFDSHNPQNKENVFHLFKINRINFYEQELIYQLADRLRLYYPETQHVNVYINYVDYGDYFFKQSYNNTFLEKNNIAGSTIFMMDKDRKGNWVIRFLWNRPKKKKVRNHFTKFLQLLRNRDPNLLGKYFDIDYIARFEALRQLLGAKTGFYIEDNIRFLYNDSNGKFYPILDESNIYNMQSNKKNENFKLLKSHIGKSSLIKQKKIKIWNELADSYPSILEKYREITRKHNRLSYDFILSLKTKIISFYYLNHVYSQLKGNKRLEILIRESKKIREKDSKQLTKTNRYLDSILLSAESFLKAHKDLKLNFLDGQLILEPGDYTISRDMFIPEGYCFVIRPGTILRIAPGVSIVSYSPVHIRGTQKNPVYIKAQDPLSPFGVFAVHGNNKGTCILNFLDFSGGDQDVINGVNHTSGLNIHNINLEMRFSKIHHNHSNTGLKVVNGSVLLKNNEFSMNFSDQVELDLCRGILFDNIFLKKNGDPNGDGISINRSEVYLENNRFNDFQDKGISIGKRSVVILYENDIRNNSIGVASKDLSSTLLFNNSLSNNRYAISVFQKNPIYGGGSCYFLQNECKANARRFKLDKFSKLFYLKNCQDYEQQLLEKIKTGQDALLFPIFKQLIKTCANEDNKIEHFSVGNKVAHIDQTKKIIFVNLPVGSGTVQTIKYRCSFEGSEISIMPIMYGINNVRDKETPAHPKMITSNTPYNFLEYIFMGEVLVQFNDQYNLYDLIVLTGDSSLVKIDTRDRLGTPRLIKNEPKIPCEFVIISPQLTDEGQFLNYGFYDLKGRIEGRGKKWVKWKYGIVLEKSISIEGLEPSKNWVLESSFVEKSLMRNKVAFDLLAQFSNQEENRRRIAPQSRFAEVILNDEYIGVYLVIQHINKDYLGLTKYDKSDPYNAVIYRSRDENANFSPFNFITPKSSDYKYFPGRRQPEQKQMDPLLGWHSGFEQRFPDPDKYGEYWAPIEEFNKFTALSSDTEFQKRIFELLDINLYIDLWIFIELLDDHDGLYKNRYLARNKGIDSKWFFIPWDKDGVFGRSFDMKKRPYNKWLTSFLFNRLLKMRFFRGAFINRWNELRNKGIIEEENIFKLIDSNKARLRDLQERNFRKWPTDFVLYPDKNSFLEEIKYMKGWIRDRILWLDTHINNLNRIYR
jgi:hypothetical protein